MKKESEIGGRRVLHTHTCKNGRFCVLPCAFNPLRLPAGLWVLSSAAIQDTLLLRPSVDVRVCVCVCVRAIKVIATHCVVGEESREKTEAKAATKKYKITIQRTTLGTLFFFSVYGISCFFGVWENFWA